MSSEQARAFGKLLRHAIGLCAAIFELLSWRRANQRRIGANY